MDKGESKMTKQEFIEKYAQPNMAVHCKTKKDAKELLKMADEFGFKWIDGDRFTEHTSWEVNREYTCYYISEGMYGSLDNVEKYSSVVIEFKLD